MCDDLNLNEVLDVAKKVNPKLKQIIAIGTDRKDSSAIIPIRQGKYAFIQCFMLYFNEII